MGGGGGKTCFPIFFFLGAGAPCAPSKLRRYWFGSFFVGVSKHAEEK